jgi:hypothetical protein
MPTKSANRKVFWSNQMSQLAPYIPAKNALLIAWANNFSTLITANPAMYGLTTGDAVAIAAEYSALNTAYALITSGSTKTAATVAAFNALKVAALALFRSYAVMVSLNAGVTSGNKAALGVNPRTSVPTPIAAPVTHPVLAILRAAPGTQVITSKDSAAGGSSKSKPYGAVALQLYAASSATPIVLTSALSFIGTFTKSPFQINTTYGVVGQQNYVAGRWVTRKGLVGPWSPIVNLVIA